ncbi:hypothetical protein B0H19DRAFT_1370589 [Mycena capillaripes]|nr:hypothetical protein B0H19DRAFT_1370589 [Mycena capillaripes]
MSQPQAAVEAFDFSKGDGEFAFLSMIWEKNDDFYHCRHSEMSYSSEELAGLFKMAAPIPRDYYLGKLPPSEMKMASVSSTDQSVYFKKITPYMYEPQRTGHYGNTPADVLFHEAQVCEEVAKNLRPNICRYLGYLPSADGRNLLGLCSQRHPLTLSRAVQDKAHLNAAAVIAGVRRGLEHLHSLGYVHASFD